MHKMCFRYWAAGNIISSYPFRTFSYPALHKENSGFCTIWWSYMLCSFLHDKNSTIITLVYRSILLVCWNHLVCHCQSCPWKRSCHNNINVFLLNWQQSPAFFSTVKQSWLHGLCESYEWLLTSLVLRWNGPSSSCLSMMCCVMSLAFCGSHSLKYQYLTNEDYRHIWLLLTIQSTVRSIHAKCQNRFYSNTWSETQEAPYQGYLLEPHTVAVGLNVMSLSYFLLLFAPATNSMMNGGSLSPPNNIAEYMIEILFSLTTPRLCS